MKKILIAGAGGAPSEGVIYSLLRSPGGEEIIGMGSIPSDLVLSAAHRKYSVPFADDISYRDSLLKILDKEHPNLIHFQNDLEVYHASLIRDDIRETGTDVFMPCHETIDTCVNKYKTYQKFVKAGIRVPENRLISNEQDLKEAFHDLGDEEGRIWLRSSSIGGGGKGALPTGDIELANAWINRFNGWGDFLAARMLKTDTVTWLSIWWHGELIVAQTRKRIGWIHGNRTLSGVTGVTKVGITVSDETVTEIAERAVYAVDEKPHGIYGVDMAYDKDGIPNPTEINISRFFTTIRFFTEAGLNMPVIFKDLALYGRRPVLDRVINPLPDGLMWLRAMDRPPLLTTKEEMEKELIRL